MSNNQKKRLFITINLPIEVKTNLLKQTINFCQVEGVKWVNEDNFHLTLHFLGDLDVNQENKLRVSLQALENKFSVMHFRTLPINAFPNWLHPKIIYLECRQYNGNSIIKLQEILGKKIIDLGLVIDKRPWRPHITLGRVNADGKINLSPEILKIEPLEFSVASFDLMESNLQPDGARYQILEKYNFV